MQAALHDESVAFDRPPTYDPFELDRLDDAALDELPFGVIALDPEGTILRYNAAEARLARLDRSTVIGRTFFGEVAPCTAVPGFKGRFDELVEGRNERGVVRFEFLFDFKFGAQQVDIEMVRVPDAERTYILVNRRSFGPAREGLDPGFPAPRQAELQPPSREVGVARDTREQRVVHAPIVLLDALLRTCDRVAPETWSIFCREWGVQWGRRAVVDLETRCLEETERSLRERPMAEVTQRLAESLRAEGWGELRFDLEGSRSTGAVTLTLGNSALVAASRRDGGRRCHLIAGMVGAVLSHLAGRRLHVEEVECAAHGHERCRMIAVGATRARAVERLAADGVPLADILTNLRTGHGSASGTSS